MTGSYPLFVGFVGLIFGLFMEGIWYALFSRTQPFIQRRSAYLIQLIRVVAIVLVLRFVLWAPQFTEAGSDEYWFVCGFWLFVLFVLGCVPMSPCLNVDGTAWRDRVSKYARYIHSLPSDVRWYLRRTTINNAIILGILALSSQLPEHELFQKHVPYVIILLPTPFSCAVLAVIRAKFDLFEPPPMEGTIIHRTSVKPPPLKPGQPDPFDVEEYLNSLPPQRD